MGFGHLRVACESQLVFLCRSLEVAPSLEDESQEIVRGRQRGLARHGLSEARVRLVQSFGFQQTDTVANQGLGLGG